MELVASVVARPEPKFKVLKENRELLIRDRVKIQTTRVSDVETEVVVTVVDVRAEDAAAYKIEAANKCGSAVSEARFVVKGEPVFVRVPAAQTLPERKNVKFDCEVIGLPLPAVEWYFKDKVIAGCVSVLLYP